MDEKDTESIARELARLNVWEKVAKHNFAIISEMALEPYLVSVNLEKAGPIAGRLLLFPGFDVFRDYRLFQEVPDYGVAMSLLDFTHWEVIALRDGTVQLYAYEPGYVPRPLSAEELSLLAPVLYECYGLFMRMEEEPDLPAKYVTQDSQRMFARKEGLDGKWRDTPLELPPVPNPLYQEQVLLDKKKCAEAAKLGIDESVSWQIEFAQLPNFHTREDRPRFLYLFAGVDETSGTRVIWDKASVSGQPNGLKSLWEGLSARLLLAVLRAGRIPAAVKVRSARLARLIRPLGLQLPFKLVQQSKLAAVVDEINRAVAMGNV